jgi:hypothetical protein
MGEETETVSSLRLATRRVISTFLDALARSHGWRKIFVISPWISEFGELGGMTFDQLLKRLRDDNATAYVVTRPPIEPWHQAAVNRIAATGQANIATVPSLHTKLYCADTDQGSRTNHWRIEKLAFSSELREPASNWFEIFSTRRRKSTAVPIASSSASVR